MFFNLLNRNQFMVIITIADSGFSQLRILLKPVVDFPLENPILAENKRSRSSQPRQAPKRWWQLLTKRAFKI